MAGWTRRNFLRDTGLGVAGASLLGPGMARMAGAAEDDGPRFLIVLCASGGASVIDSVLAIREGESADAAKLNCHPDALVHEVGPFRAVKVDSPVLGPIPMAVHTDQRDVLKRRQADLMAATWTRTSVNHKTGQRRSVTGNEAWAGRTLQEAVAAQYGERYPLPNVHLIAGVGYTERGTDDTLPDWARGETVADPRLWPLSLDGVDGVDGAPGRKLVNLARDHRNESFDPATKFSQVFAGSPRLQRWQNLRGRPQWDIEAQDLIRRLMVPPSSPRFPLKDFGLRESKDAAAVRAAFPSWQTDPLDAQAALAFLLLKNKVSVTVTLGPHFDLVVDGDINLSGAYGQEVGDEGLPPGSIANPPIAFDFSHQSHRAVQALMWERVLRVCDGLATLLQGEEYEAGQSMWDRTMIYVATDFGRSKSRPANAPDFGTGHDLNNGVVVMSPLVNGGKVLGGVDPDTALTYGFDPKTGAPEPGRNMEEAEIFAGLVGALGLDTKGSGLPDVPAMRKGG